MQSIIQKAKKHLNVALEHNPQHIPSVLLLSDILFEEQKYDQVQTLIDQIKGNVEGMIEIIFLHRKQFLLKKIMRKRLNLLIKQSVKTLVILNHTY